MYVSVSNRTTVRVLITYIGDGGRPVCINCHKGNRDCVRPAPVEQLRFVVHGASQEQRGIELFTTRSGSLRGIGG